MPHFPKLSGRKESAPKYQPPSVARLRLPFLTGIGMKLPCAGKKSSNSDPSVHKTGKRFQSLKKKSGDVALKNHRSLQHQSKFLPKSNSYTKTHLRIPRIKIQDAKSNITKLPRLKDVVLKTTEKDQRLLEERMRMWKYGNFTQQPKRYGHNFNQGDNAKISSLAAKLVEPIKKKPLELEKIVLDTKPDNTPQGLYMVPVEWPDEICPLFKFPEKIRVKILKMIPHIERENLQFVCRQIRNEIRIRAGLAAVITDRKEDGLVFMRDVVMDKIIVQKYNNPVLIHPSQLIGKACDVVQLSFRDPICTQHLDGFASKCRRIKNLFLDAPIAEHAPLMNVQGKYRKAMITWRTLETIREKPIVLLRMEKLSVRIPGGNSRFTIARLFQTLKFPNLKSLSIKTVGLIDISDSCLLHIKIMTIIITMKHLERIWLQVDHNCSKGPGNKRPDILNLKKSDLKNWGRATQLKEIILLETKSPLCHKSWDWVALIQEQKSLKVLQVFHFINIWTCRDIILRNQKTLRKVAIHTLLSKKTGHYEPVDLSVFRECENLAELYIWLGQTSSAKCLNSFCNFGALPPSIKVLALKNGHFLENDFVDICKGLPRLQSLGVLCSKLDPSVTDLGLTLFGLKQLLRCRKLDELLLTGFNYNTIKPRVDHLALEVFANHIEIPIVNDLFHWKHQEKDLARWELNPSSIPKFTLVTPWLITTHINP